MRTLAGWGAALILILSMTAAPATAYEHASTCDCDLRADNTLWMAGLVPGQRYVAWWWVSETEDGEPYYAASQGALRAVADGRIPVFLFPDTEPGWYEVYVERAVWDPELGRWANATYDESVALRECELWLR